MNDIDIASLLIRLSIGAIMVLFGINQLKNHEYWKQYMPKFVQFILPISLGTFFKMHGIINIGLGIFLMSGFAQPVSVCVSLAWWLSILPFAFYYHWTTGLRDLAISMALLALVFIS